MSNNGNSDAAVKTAEVNLFAPNTATALAFKHADGLAAERV
jgi:hypothetical protein